MTDFKPGDLFIWKWMSQEWFTQYQYVGDICRLVSYKDVAYGESDVKYIHLQSGQEFFTKATIDLARQARKLTITEIAKHRIKSGI